MFGSCFRTLADILISVFCFGFVLFCLFVCLFVFKKLVGMPIVNQTNAGTVSKATLGEILGVGVKIIIMGFSQRIDTILN